MAAAVVRTSARATSMNHDVTTASNDAGVDGAWRASA